ncbi:MAG: DUF4244 domain-containing protein [Marmoricola sp.]|nr:DUF4244 domain-containing protein [Marmoricola sp.]
MHHTALATTRQPDQAARPSLRLVRDATGASTAEYATVTGCGVGFAAVLFKFLTSSAGQQLISVIFRAIRALLPF